MHKYFLILLSIIVLSHPSSAGSYCHQEECFTDKVELALFDEEVVNIYYNSLFEIGENWFIVIWFENSTESSIEIVFDFGNDISKSLEIEEGSSNYTDSLSFSGSTFNSERFNKELNVSFNGNTIILKIDINKKPAEDMVYLWGGMSVFWFAIGIYVLYLSDKLRTLSRKVKRNND